MTRQLRIENEGAFYHVLSRGNERKEIFRGDKNSSVFTEILGEMPARFFVDIVAYALMDNHYDFCSGLKEQIFRKAYSGLDKDKRDILILLLWNTGLYRNYEIAKTFNITCRCSRWL